MDDTHEAILVHQAFISPEARAALKELLHPLVEEKAAEYRAQWNALAVPERDFVNAGLAVFDYTFNLYLKNMNRPEETPFSTYYVWFMRQAMRRVIDPSHDW